MRAKINSHIGITQKKKAKRFKDDTEYLMSNPETVKRLKESMAQAKRGELHTCCTCSK